MNPYRYFEEAKSYSIRSASLINLYKVDETTDKFAAVFQEEFTHTVFTCLFSLPGYEIYTYASYYYPFVVDYPDDTEIFTDSSGLKRAKINYHLVVNPNNQYKILFFKTTLDTDTFSFEAEFERSFSA